MTLAGVRCRINVLQTVRGVGLAHDHRRQHRTDLAPQLGVHRGPTRDDGGQPVPEATHTALQPVHELAGSDVLPEPLEDRLVGVEAVVLDAARTDALGDLVGVRLLAAAE